jgi:hypothetical protein
MLALSDSKSLGTPAGLVPIGPAEFRETRAERLGNATTSNGSHFS